MPALSSVSLMNTLVVRNATAANATANPYLQVVCAWPVSGQYGLGSRILYYVLVAACVFARNVKWLRKACLAATLLFPAVAALHGIVLAAVPTDGGIDLDIFGAFQLCSIGILAAPVTVKVSGTYFNDPGRNAIFAWTGLILSGLLSLTVQFFRLSTKDCIHDEFGHAVSPKASEFGYNTTCGLICNTDQGPFSPMRGGSADDVYVVPAPDILTFGMATLLSAACCIPAVLSLISMWYKILEIKWKTSFGDGGEENKIIDGTNGATNAAMMRVKNQVRKFMLAVEIPVFGAAVLAILIIGERNFFSAQVRYKTEPMASIGQWAPIAGTVLAVMGSLYLLLAGGELEERLDTPRDGHVPSPDSVISADTDDLERRSVNAARESSEPDARSTAMGRSFSTPGETSGQSRMAKLGRSTTGSTMDVGNRRNIAKILEKFSDITHPSAERFNYDAFKHGIAAGWPTLPGEEERNPKLNQTRKQFNESRDVDGSVAPMRPSRAASFTGSAASIRHPSPSPSHSPRDASFPFDRTSSEMHTISTPPGALMRGRARRDTLEVPTISHHSLQTNSSFVEAVPDSPSSPIIIISKTTENDK
ncbi:hypothetical protein VE01_01970 [Pseudogymnoascus verrucosus]|uniref:Uncharacterized protein n=1 Tax=Pseudogymnoascus verrucosus TaxID=342668 RepID=A0A1B8GVC9_9PEZI|nr:uncharacterized protein VE01_01970 [Pseudogymnoascus verrucosus]OBT99791.2 hypothetical protein VE01_01970 [Pseudogymnoascus verrucosus]